MDTQDENRQPKGDAALITPHIPDFKGYSDKNQRNDADTQLRTYIIRQLESFKTTLEEIIQAVAAEKRLDLLSDYEDIMKSIDSFKELLTEPPADCGDFFELENLPEEELAGIYLLDYQLLEKSALLQELLTGLKDNPLERNDARALDSRVREMITFFTERSISMKGCRCGEEIS